jgi:hypothetical protein
MSSPEEIFVARIKALSAIVGSTGLSATIYPDSFPEGGSLPAITYEMSGDNPVNHAGGATGTHETHITVHCMATTYAGVKSLAALVVGDEDSSPSGISGWVDGDGNVWHLDSQRDEPGDIIVGQDVKHYYGMTQEFSVWN